MSENGAYTIDIRHLQLPSATSQVTEDVDLTKYQLKSPRVKSGLPGNMSIDSKPVETDGKRGRYRQITFDSGAGESVVNPDEWFGCRSQQTIRSHSGSKVGVAGTRAVKSEMAWSPESRRRSLRSEVKHQRSPLNSLQAGRSRWATWKTGVNAEAYMLCPRSSKILNNATNEANPLQGLQRMELAP